MARSEFMRITKESKPIKLRLHQTFAYGLLNKVESEGA